MSKPTRAYPHTSVDATGTGVVSHAGTVLLLRTAEKTGLTTALSTGLASWRKPLTIHDPGKIVLDLAVALALGGDCLADIPQLRNHPEVFDRVASDPTVSRLVTALAADTAKALTVINTARRTGSENPLVIDLDATLVTALSEK